MFDLGVKHILPGMGLFFYFVLHFNCKFAIYNEDNELIKNGLPDELYSDSGLVAKVNVLNRQYSELFTNNGYEFRYSGFKTHEDENAFERDFNAIYEEIAERTRGKYRVINEYYFTSNTEDVRDL